MSLARYADETQHQRGQHREIAVRYRAKTSNKDVNLRKHELQLIFAKRYGEERLPDDDAGRDDLRLMFDHLVQLGVDRCRWWADVWVPLLPDADIDAMIRDAGQGRHWSAAALGKALNFTNAERRQLDVRTIRPVDRTRKQLAQDVRERDAARKRARRLEAGARPRKQSLSKTKPWVKLGMSRRTYERKGLNVAVDANSAVILLVSQCQTKLRHSVPERPQGAPLWHALRPFNAKLPTEPRVPEFIVVTASCCNIA
jgi:hypothetical protein